jgi:hypothetical protein
VPCPAEPRQARIAAAIVISIVLCACAAQPHGPFFDDEKYLVFGVDPDAEANALVRELQAQGFTVEPRLRGEHFSALGLIRPDLSSAGVRVITARGIALALDHVPPSIFQEEVRYQLRAPPYPDTHDADGDGFEEVFVEITRGSGARARSCIAIYRVRDSGFIDGVDGRKFSIGSPPPGREAIWQAPSFCELEASSEPAANPTDAGGAAPATRPEPAK